MSEARIEVLRGQILSVASAAVKKPAKGYMREIIMEEAESQIVMIVRCME